MINIPYPFKIKSIEVEIEIGKVKTTSYRIVPYRILSSIPLRSVWLADWLAPFAEV